MLAAIVWPIKSRAAGPLPQFGPVPPAIMVTEGMPLRICIEVSSVGPVTLQWYAVGAATAPTLAPWTHDNLPVLGATNSCFTARIARPSHSGDCFLTARNQFGESSSDVVSVTVLSRYTLGLWNGDAFAGSDAGFYIISAVAEMKAVPQIAWFHDGKRIPEEHDPNLTLSQVSTNDAGDYYAVITERNGIAYKTPPVPLNVRNAQPYVFGPGTGANVIAGEVAFLNASMWAERFQWQRNGVNIPGATNAFLFFPSTQSSDSGTYDVLGFSGSAQMKNEAVLTTRPATPLDSWNWLSPVPQGAALRAITYGNGRFVAVGAGGSTVASADGEHWVASRVRTSRPLDYVAFGNGVFVAAAVYGATFTSTDGISWTAVNPPPEAVSGLTFGAGRFVATTYGYATCISTDGKTWERVGTAVPTAEVFFAKNRFIRSFSGFNSQRAFHFSTDGQHWRAKLPPLDAIDDYSNLAGVAQGSASEILALTLFGNVYKSRDGIAWKHLVTISDAASFGFSGIAAKRGLYVVTTADPQGTVTTSRNGVSWTPVSTGAGHELNAITYGGGKFVAVGASGTIVSSSDGAGWHAAVSNHIDLFSVTEGNDSVIAVGHHGVVATYADGTMSTQFPVAHNLHTILHTNGLFVAAGENGTIITSSNAVDWAVHPQIDVYSFQRVAHLNGKWIAVGEYNTAAISDNGLDWVGLNTTSVPTDHEGVAFMDGRWIIVGGHVEEDTYRPISTIYTSLDATNWTAVDYDATERLRDVTSGNGMFVAVGNNGIVDSSTNGLNWVRVDLGGRNFRRVIFANGRFIAVGNDGACFSSATPAVHESWVRHRMAATQNLHDIFHRADGRFLTVGNNQAALQTD